jgi:hypothetical protein
MEGREGSLPSVTQCEKPTNGAQYSFEGLPHGGPFSFQDLKMVFNFGS